MNNRVFCKSNSTQNDAHASDPSKQVIFPWTVSCVVSSYMAGQCDLSPAELRTEWTLIIYYSVVVRGTNPAVVTTSVCGLQIYPPRLSRRQSTTSVV